MAEATTLVKYLAAHSGYSRRNATDLIKEGKVTVNSSVVVEPWHEIQPGDDVRVEGKRVKEGDKVYFLLNKPEGYITTMEDDLGRADVSLLMKSATKERIFPIGRLDKDTTGLLIFTNDGELAQHLSHPRFKMKKEYQVTLDKPVNPEHLRLMFKGVFLPDGNARVDRAALMPGKRKYVVIVEIHSGKKHIIRRLFQHFGYDVRALDRIEYAGLNKRGLPVGKWRALTKDEVASLQTMAEAAAAAAPKPRKGAPKSRDSRYSSDRKRTDYRTSSASGRERAEKRTSKFRDGKPFERPELRRKKELVIGTEEWFAQDDVKPVERSRSRDDRDQRSDDTRSRTRDDRPDSKASFRRSDSGAPKKDYSPKRPSRPNNDREERTSWREQRESSSDVESWFNQGDDERPTRSRSRSGAPTRSRTDRGSSDRDDARPKRRTDFREDSDRSTGRSQYRDNRGERPSWRDKRESGVEGDDARPKRRTDFREDSRPQRRFDSDRAPRRDDGRERPSWRDKRESGVEGEDARPRRRTDFREDSRPQRRFDSDRAPRRDDRAERPSWRDKRESGVEGEDTRPRRRTDFREDSRPQRRFDSDRAPRRDDRAERPSWRDKRESGAEREPWSRDGEDAKPRSRSKPATPRTRSTSSGSKPKATVRTKPAHVRTKPGGGGKPKSRTGGKKSSGTKRK